jgi:hypothetical protein
MEPELRPPAPHHSTTADGRATKTAPEPLLSPPAAGPLEPPEPRSPGPASAGTRPAESASAESEPALPALSVPAPAQSIWFGPHGLRAGWSLLLFTILVYLLAAIFGTILILVVEQGLHWNVTAASASSTILGESEWVAALVAALSLLSLAEHRRVTDYYLVDRQALSHFAAGALAGFTALSLLVGAMAAGGWICFGNIALTKTHILKYGLLWALAFLLVALFEEGTFRCFVQFTLTRAINFWWAAAIVGAMCAYLLATAKGNGEWGIYASALLGVGPCLWMHLKKSPHRRFWQASWAGSTAFGFIHTSNHGETWIGIFAAAAIGFAFCVSVRVLGSAWWAIGCHAAWDWAESFFYGTADSGFSAKGHYLTTIPSGSALWSGGTDGPEGSILVLPVIALLLLALLLYARKNPPRAIA